MAKIHDKFVIELAEVIKGYGNNPADEDPFRLSEFYRFYELPNIAVSRENFEKMLPIEPERKRARLEYVDYGGVGNWHCTACRQIIICNGDYDFCPYCGADLREGEQDG